MAGLEGLQIQELVKKLSCSKGIHQQVQQSRDNFVSSFSSEFRWKVPDSRSVHYWQWNWGPLVEGGSGRSWSGHAVKLVMVNRKQNRGRSSSLERASTGDGQATPRVIHGWFYLQGLETASFGNLIDSKEYLSCDCGRAEVRFPLCQFVQNWACRRQVQLALHI